MTNDSIHAPGGAKTIFNTREIDFKEEIKSLSREALEIIANEMSFRLCCLHDDVITLLTDKDASPEKIGELAESMYETLSYDVGGHDALYGGKPREILLSMFPSLRGEGDVA